MSPMVISDQMFRQTRHFCVVHEFANSIPETSYVKWYCFTLKARI